ncbi:hypothetical protein ACWDXD_24990 [Streptomyces sp. NPDC003314]
MTTSSAPFSPSVSVNSIDEAMMCLPYERWTAMPEAAARVQAAGLPRERLTTVVRTGRRRGVLRTRKDPGHAVTYVRRITTTPYPQPGPAST